MVTGRSTGDGRLKKAGARLSAGCLVPGLFLVLALLSYAHAASETIFTIQAGSFRGRPDAFRQFDFLQRKLSEQGREYLRVEKIGKFHAVRLGKFDDRLKAEEFLDANKSLLRGAIVMDAYFIPARIEKLYKNPSPAAEAADERDTPPAADTATEVMIPETVEEQAGMISDMLDKHDYENALKLAKAAVARRPDDPGLNAWYGTVLLKMDRPEEALKYFRKASESRPDVSGYYSGAGYCLSFSGRFEEAVDEFSRALALDPDNIDALTGLGVAYAKTGRKDRAMDIYIRLKDLESDTAGKLLKIIEGQP